MPGRLARAIGFVDWNTAVIASGATRRNQRPAAVARTALEHVERVVSDYLVESAAGSRYQVRLRLYGGWHAGTTATPHLQGVVKVRDSYGGRARTYSRNRVTFLGGTDGIRLGSRLACVPGRLPRRYDFHLLDTLRPVDRGRGERHGERSEKMVDTALVVDLLGLATRREADLYVVVSDDDDMLPGLFAAEAAGARVGMLSRPGKRSRFMGHAADLVSTYESVGP